jgi:hypothetical protein
MVAITICSWIAISNHCAFSAIATKTGPAQNGCPFHSKPSTPQPQPIGTACCKILRAVATTPAKNLAPTIGDLPHFDLGFAELPVFTPPKILFTAATLDTGPPGRTFFAELIGSIRAHAPPFTV